MTTARDLITRGLKKISVIGVGSTLSDEEAQDGLNTLNALLSSFSARGGVVYTETIEDFPLVSGKQTYTIGSGGDFDTTIPFDISAMYVTIGTTDYYLNPYDEKQWASITQKGIKGIPDVYYFNAGYPLADINLYNIPTTGTLTIHSKKYLTAFTDLDSVFSMPPEYEGMLIYNLAVWIAPEYEREASPTVKKVADQTYKTTLTRTGRNKKNISSLDVPASENNRGVGDFYKGNFT